MQGLYGMDLVNYITSAAVVVAPLHYSGRTFPTYLRISMCLRHGVPVVAEYGGDAADRQEHLMSALGGVYLVSYDELPDKALEVARQPRLWRLTETEAQRWTAFSAAAVAWDGSFGGLEELFVADRYL